MPSSPAEIFGDLPYPQFPHLLFVCFPILVLVVCIHVVGGGGSTGGHGTFSFCIGASSTLIRYVGQELVSVFQGGLRGFFASLIALPPLLLLLVPPISFFYFRLLPLFLQLDSVAPASVCLSGYWGFSASPEWGVGISDFMQTARSIFDISMERPQLRRVLLHALYFSSSSVVLWLLAAPLALFSAALLLHRASQDQRNRSLGGKGNNSWGLILVVLPVTAGLMTALLLLLLGHGEVCFTGFFPLLLSLGYLAFFHDPKMQVDLGGEGWYSFVSSRWLVSSICFAFFAFQPIGFDLIVLAAAAASAISISAASRCSFPLGAGAALTGIAAAVGISNKSAGAGNASLSLSSSLVEGHTTPSLVAAGAFKSLPGLFLVGLLSTAALGLVLSSRDIVSAVFAASRHQGLWRRIAVVASSALCLLWLPFSLMTTPRSVFDFFAGPEPALYAILLSHQEVVVGALAAKLWAFWLPLYLVAPAARLKTLLSVVAGTAILVAMASDMWGGIGPGFLLSVVSLYFFIRL